MNKTVKTNTNSKQYSKNSLVVTATIFTTIGILIMNLIYTYAILPKLNGTKNDQEIERKWLINPKDMPFNIPEEAKESWHIKQTYINFSPEIRVREITDSKDNTYWTMAVKSDMTADGMTRTEKEWYIEKSEYEKLMAKAEPNAKTISKTRYSVYKDNVRYEYDIFHDQLDGLAYVEKEFDSFKAAKKFVTPRYVGKDVTADKRYKNQALAQFGTPEP